MPELYLVFCLVGAVSGLLIGVLGTGSSLVMMPSLVLLFPPLFPQHDALRLAVGTTVATMTVGALAGAVSHLRRRNVDTGVFVLMVPGYVCGALLGPWLSRLLPSAYLRLYLSAVLIAVAVRMLTARRAASRDAPRRPQGHAVEIRLVSLLVALAGSIAGIASGLFAIPYLSRFAIPLHRVVGTSTSAAAVYALAALVGYVSSGWSAVDAPPATVGFVYLPVFAVMALAMAVSVPAGVRLAGRIDEQPLHRAFAVFLLVAGVAIAWLTA